LEDGGRSPKLGIHGYGQRTREFEPDTLDLGALLMQ
jgi:hypothetical protein